MEFDTGRELMVRLGAAIAGARALRRLSQESLAERLGIAKNYVGQLERGERAPSLEMLARLGRVLDLSLDELLVNRRHAQQERSEAEALLSSISPELMPLITDFLRLAVQRSAARPPKTKSAKT